MQKLKNKVSGVEHIITGSIGVPRETEENVFEVWMHFSVDTDGDGQIETIEVPPINPEWEVIDVPDPEPVVVEPEPDPIIEPEPIPEPTPEELEAQEAMQARNEWFQKKNALAQMIDDMERAQKIGKEASQQQLAIMNALAEWIDANLKQEYYF